ncbi:unnamed protein product [Polarella glacialis]|uniref:Uncharacterized protein n=1 Tax=Polarella glacialis TaxID=89957 RepID=A0A813ISV7_POLGL|nr:unnamed protein product [Polarella glacialis]
MHRVDVERHILGRRVLRGPELELLGGLNDLLRQWSEKQIAELAGRLDAVLLALKAAHRRAPLRSPEERPARRVAVLMACTPDSASSELCQLGANLWQCYAQQHGYHFHF